MRSFNLVFGLAALFLPSAGRAYIITGPTVSTFQDQYGVGGLATLDLDGDGNPDIEVFAIVGATPLGTPDAGFGPAGLNLQVTQFVVYKGWQIDGSQEFGIGGHDYHLSPSQGYWGFRFTSGGATHYGWGYVDLMIGAGPSSASFGPWAYESEPDIPIIVGTLPEPAMGALFLLGISAVLRRRRSR